MFVNSIFSASNILGLKKYLCAISDLLFPKVCGFCNKAINPEIDITGLCHKCSSSIPFRFGSDRIVKCIEERHLVHMHVPLSDNFQVIVACHYRNPVRHALLQMKFHEASYYKETFASLMSIALKQSGLNVDMLIPVPLHVKRKRERGYNQASKIAEGISKMTGIPVNYNCLVRQKHTHRQSESKSISQRFSNMTGVFVCINPQELVGKNILLIDDVLTSGSTLFNAAQACRHAVNEIDKVNHNYLIDEMKITGLTLASDR